MTESQLHWTKYLFASIDITGKTSSASCRQLSGIPQKTEKSRGESSIMIPVNDRIATSVDEVASHVVSTARLNGN